MRIENKELLQTGLIVCVWEDVRTSTLKGRGSFLIVWMVVVFLTVIFDLSGPFTYPVWVSILCLKMWEWVIWIRWVLKFLAFQFHILVNHTRKCGWESGEIRTFLYCWKDCKLVQFGGKVAVWIKLKMYIPCDSAIPFLGIFLRKTFTYVYKETKAKIFTAVFQDHKTRKKHNINIYQ